MEGGKVDQIESKEGDGCIDERGEQEIEAHAKRREAKDLLMHSRQEVSYHSSDTRSHQTCRDERP